MYHENSSCICFLFLLLLLQTTIHFLNVSFFFLLKCDETSISGDRLLNLLVPEGLGMRKGRKTHTEKHQGQLGGRRGEGNVGMSLYCGICGKEVVRLNKQV